MRKAEEIKKDVVNQLAWDSRVDASNISVKVEDNEVSLSGTVPFFSEKDNAENIAWAVDGVYSIDNELNVKFPPTSLTPLTICASLSASSFSQNVGTLPSKVTSPSSTSIETLDSSTVVFHFKICSTVSSI
jgi:hypothetical protein